MDTSRLDRSVLSRHAIHAWCLRRAANNHTRARDLADTIGDFLRAFQYARGRGVEGALIRHWGSRAALGRALGVSGQVVGQWFQLTRIPRERWNAIIAASVALEPPLVLTWDDFLAWHDKAGRDNRAA